MRLILVFALMVVMISAVPTTAAECEGISYPENTTVGETQLILNGLGLREATVMKVDVYVAALYLESSSSSGEDILNSTGPKKLVLTFIRNVSKDKVSHAWSKGLKQMAGANMSTLEDRVTRLNGWMEDLTEGSTLEFIYRRKTDSDIGLEIAINREQKGVISGDDFSTAFFAIWLGPKPVVNEGLKTGLLGGKCS